MHHAIDAARVDEYVSSKIDRTIFKRERYECGATIPENIASNIDANTELFHMVSAYTRDLVLRLVHDVYIAEDSETIKVPASWWDMFKEAKFPEWLKAKYPPKFVERKIIKKILMVDGHKVDAEFKPFYEYRRPEFPKSQTFRG